MRWPKKKYGMPQNASNVRPNYCSYVAMRSSNLYGCEVN